MQYLYADGDLYNFMDVNTYEQIALSTDVVGDALKFVKENETVKVCSYNGKVFSVEAPLFVELEITDTEPGFKGDTATGATKRLLLRQALRSTFRYSLTRVTALRSIHVLVSTFPELNPRSIITPGNLMFPGVSFHKRCKIRTTSNVIVTN